MGWPAKRICGNCSGPRSGLSGKYCRACYLKPTGAMIFGQDAPISEWRLDNGVMKRTKGFTPTQASDGEKVE